MLSILLRGTLPLDLSARDLLAGEMGSIAPHSNTEMSFQQGRKEGRWNG